MALGEGRRRQSIASPAANGGMHMLIWKRATLLLALALSSAWAAVAAWAQEPAVANYPNRPVRMIVGFAAGGGNDLFARLIGQKLSERLGQPVVIENRPGAGGRLAVEYAMGQGAEGYTLVVGATGQMAIAAAIYPKLPYHPTRTFTPLAMIASFPLILAGPMDDTIRSVQDLVTWGKAHPDRSNYATSSPAFTITTELFKLKTGMPAQAIPYKSSNEMMLSIAGGQTLFAIADGPPTVPLVLGGKIRALAVTGAARSSELLEVPSMAEVGLPDVNIGLWSGIFVLAGTPAAISNRIESELRAVLADDGVRKKLKAMAVDPGASFGDAFRRTIDADIKMFSDIVQAANLKFEE
jgi:tripartite-type tricarboxylate transporter receptor subunit TctC